MLDGVLTLLRSHVRSGRCVSEPTQHRHRRRDSATGANEKNYFCRVLQASENAGRTRHVESRPLCHILDQPVRHNISIDTLDCYRQRVRPGRR